jgi:hypothetical protein
MQESDGIAAAGGGSSSGYKKHDRQSPSTSPKSKYRKHSPGGSSSGVFSQVISLFSSSQAKKRQTKDEYQLQTGQAFAVGGGEGAGGNESAPLLKKDGPQARGGEVDNEVEFEDDLERDEDGHVKVLERNYHANDDFFLDDEQRGRLMGIDSVHVSGSCIDDGSSSCWLSNIWPRQDSEGKIWAAASLEERGSVQRRWQTEGPRFDSEAIDASLRAGDKGPTNAAQSAGDGAGVEPKGSARSVQSGSRSPPGADADNSSPDEDALKSPLIPKVPSITAPIRKFSGNFPFVRQW